MDIFSERDLQATCLSQDLGSLSWCHQSARRCYIAPGHLASSAVPRRTPHSYAVSIPGIATVAMSHD